MPGSRRTRVILEALTKSLLVAFWVTVLSTLIGTTAAFPLVRANIKNRGGVRVFITLPIMMPGLLIGVAILVLASNVLHIQPSLKVAIIGQTVLATPFVILVVSSRLEALDRNFERAAADLGAGPVQRLLFVVLPLVYPGIIAGALIAATLSLDEFVVTNFIIGADQTLPIYIYNQLKFGITPEVNALATMMLLGTLAVVGVTFGALRLVKVLASVTKKSKQLEEVKKRRAVCWCRGRGCLMVQKCDVSVVLEAFLDHSLDEALTWLSTEVPEVTAVEVGAGGYAPHPHLDPDALLTDASARQAWLGKLAGHGIKLDALNVWGNPLHPDEAVAADHDAALRRAVRLAGELGTNTIVAMSGAPAAAAGDHAAVFGAGGWLPYLEGVHDRQWEESVVPYWTELSEFAAKENPDVKICIELHPGTTVYNVETFEKFITLGENLYANLDPSHFFWMQMDADRIVERIMPRIGHVHAKDVTFNEEALGLNGLLDHRWPASPEKMPWNFSVPGHGKDAAWWHQFIARFEGSKVQAFSIEHEDPFVDSKTGVKETAVLIKSALAGSN